MKSIKKLKKEYNIFLLYNVILIVLYVASEKFDMTLLFKKYILFETTNFKFQELLSILVTILSIVFGAILTVSTVLISMCERRLMKLINNFHKSTFVIKSIKKSITEGILAVVLYAIVYAQLDYKIYLARILILYVATFLLVMFISNSRILVNIVLSLLNASLENDDSIRETVRFKKHKQDKSEKEDKIN